MPDQTPPPRSPIREFPIEDSTLAALRVIVEQTAELPPESSVRALLHLGQGGSRFGSPLAALTVVATAPAPPSTP